MTSEYSTERPSPTLFTAENPATAIVGVEVKFWDDIVVPFGTSSRIRGGRTPLVWAAAAETNSMFRIACLVIVFI
jgi:hypothetical protein